MTTKVLLVNTYGIQSYTIMQSTTDHIYNEDAEVVVLSHGVALVSAMVYQNMYDIQKQLPNDTTYP